MGQCVEGRREKLLKQVPFASSEEGQGKYQIDGQWYLISNSRKTNLPEGGELRI